MTQLAGPWALIKAKAVKKTMNGIREAEGRGLSEICLPRRWGNHRTGVRDKKGLLSWYGKPLLFADSKESLLVPYDS